VVSKADLITALRVYVPQLTDLVVMGDDLFLLAFGHNAGLEGAQHD
jgi:hypothetical protein